LVSKGDIFTSFCHKFIRVTVCKKLTTRPQLDWVIAEPTRVQFLCPTV